MAKSLGVKFVCSNCGATYSKWSGRCTTCGQWNTLVEQVEISTATAGSSGKQLKTESVAGALKTKLPRLDSGIAEVNEVLGGGFIAGSVNLLAGQPGIGKSTLLLQIAHNAAKNHKVLYVSGEESAQQIALRAERLRASEKTLQLAVSNSTNDIAATISSSAYELVIVDSIQTVAVNEVASAAGNVSQITNSAQLLSAAAKASNTALILVGHVTKEGSIAGPKILEHMVDVVLQLEGDRYGGFKIYPKRTASGIDLNRVNLLIAMLERRTKLKLADRDIYVNIVGGIRLTEPAADLAVCMAIASAAKGMQLKKNAVVFGEVGLSGEVRHVPFAEKRVAEAKKMGFEAAIGPEIRTGKKPTLLTSVKDVRSALNTFLEKD
jgi:predicted ATP-dependent serine protease